MNGFTETILEHAENIGRVRLLNTLIDRVTRRVLPQATAAALGCLLGSSCRPNDACGSGRFQYMYNVNHVLCDVRCCNN